MKKANIKKGGLLNWAFKLLILLKYGKKIRKIFPILYPWCRDFPHTIVILSDGSVTTCCFDPFGENTFGSVYKNDIAEIWNNQIKNILSEDLYNLKKCRKCIGSRHAPLLSKRTDYFQWQSFAFQYPKVIQVEIIAKCNYGCCCANKIYKYRQIKSDLDKIFENIKSFLPKIKPLNLYNYGEPLLHNGLCDFIKKCRQESDTLYIELRTNGILMDEKICKCLIEQKINTVCVSIHGGPGTENMLRYSKYGANYDKVMANIKQLIELRKMDKNKFPKVRIKTILFDWNDTDELMDWLRKDAKAAGVDGLDWILDGGTGGSLRSSKRFTKRFTLSGKEL